MAILYEIFKIRKKITLIPLYDFDMTFGKDETGHDSPLYNVPPVKGIEGNFLLDSIMKISEVPQDDIKTLHGEKKAVYAVDDQGHYTKTTTRGWKAEEIVLDQVIGDFKERAEEALLRVRHDETSPIEYFMYKNWMDPLTLAQAMGLYRWQVKRHFKPGVFKELDDKILVEYARLFRVSVDDLKHFPGED